MAADLNVVWIDVYKELESFLSLNIEHGADAVAAAAAAYDDDVGWAKSTLKSKYI